MTTMLYHAPSTAALVVHWMLIELQVPHVLHPLDFDRREQKSPAYLALNPAGVVPTLVLEGQVMTEAAAIVLHLADLHPQAGLAPPPGTPARAAYYQWMFFCANTLQPAFRAWFYPDEPAGAEQVDAAQAQARQKLEAAWAQVDAHLQGARPVSAGRHAIGGRFPADHADALVAQYAQTHGYLARLARACPADEGAARLPGDLPARGPDRLDLNVRRASEAMCR